MAVGRVVRFDGMRGYGFIAPDRGGDDVFLHVNDLLFPESSVRSGLAVEFEVEDGGRGLKASEVRIAPGAAQAAEGAPARAGIPGPRTPVAPEVPVGDAGSTAPAGDVQEKTCDLLSAAEYGGEVTELLLASAPELTGRQIVAVRESLVAFGRQQGWVED
ncbi:putative cold-shock DNA-binding protein [Actinacidiphila reveromycinica]|uniref:Putative cold-shock DNA-binding protein n=1 Tax=Actinacidiphila reveromycinica TaxID=659352 RepID=A0A7U3V0U8_9ACTN|nr:cold shock domain-containing protein [Streptomyces sp. SN-593]BBB02247.1 putative cold-shock DNA-binding protein [Streptomyces sp. SN-593]